MTTDKPTDKDERKRALEDARKLDEMLDGASEGPWEIYRQPITSRQDAMQGLWLLLLGTHPHTDNLVMMVDADGKCPALTGCGPKSEANAALLRFLRTATPSIARVLLSEAKRADELETQLSTVLQRESATQARHDARVEDLPERLIEIAQERLVAGSVSGDADDVREAAKLPEALDKMRQRAWKAEAASDDLQADIATLTARIEKLEAALQEIDKLTGAAAVEYAMRGEFLPTFALRINGYAREALKPAATETEGV